MKHRTWPTAAMALGAAGVVVALGGCSMIKGLEAAGVITDSVLGAAVGDVLLANNVEILSGPTCDPDSSNPKAFTCSGTTTKRQPISVTTGGTTQEPTMTVTVAGKVLYSGSVMAVLEKAAQSE